MKFNFQTIFLGILGLAIVAAVIIFATTKGDSGTSGAQAAKVTIWSTFPQESSPIKALGDFGQRNYEKVNVTYVYKDPLKFQDDFIYAVAQGTAPDLLLVPDNQLLGLEKFISPLTDSQLPPQAFQQSYIGGASSMRSAGGTLALPLLADPLVLFAHKDLMANASLVATPHYWDELTALQEGLTKREGNNFAQSMIAIGSYGNVTHAKDVIGTMLLQAGVPIVARGGNGALMVSLDSATQSTGEEPANAILRFWSDFANPAKTLYSWNALQPESRDTFAAEKLVFYPGLASDRARILRINPHLNFSAAQIPQFRGARAEITGGRIWGLAVVKKDKNVQAQGMLALSIIAGDSQFITDWSKSAVLPPARLDLLAKKPADPVLSTYYDAAIRMRSWLDPDPELSNAAFGAAVDGIASGKYLPEAAATSIAAGLNAALRKIK